VEKRESEVLHEIATMHILESEQHLQLFETKGHCCTASHPTSYFIMTEDDLFINKEVDREL